VAGRSGWFCCIFEGRSSRGGTDFGYFVPWRGKQNCFSGPAPDSRICLGRRSFSVGSPVLCRVASRPGPDVQFVHVAVHRVQRQRVETAITAGALPGLCQQPMLQQLGDCHAQRLTARPAARFHCLGGQAQIPVARGVRSKQCHKVKQQLCRVRRQFSAGAAAHELQRDGQPGAMDGNAVLFGAVAAHLCCLSRKGLADPGGSGGRCAMHWRALHCAGPGRPGCGGHGEQREPLRTRHQHQRPLRGR